LNAILGSYWVHDLDPFLWQFPESFSHWGPGGIRWYGIAYLAGFVSAFFLFKRYHKQKRSPYDSEQIMNLMTFLILGVLLGGRIGYALLYRWDEFLADPLILLRVWEGGMASHGGFAGVCIAVLLYARHSKQSAMPIGDLIVSAVSPGLFFGRIANFINGELWGKVTDCSWGMIFPKAPGVRNVLQNPEFSKDPSLIPTEILEQIVRHPSQLYAATLEGLCTFIFIQWRFWKTDVTQRMPGRLAGEFLIAYAVARIANEFFREPDASLIMGMSRGQFYSIYLFIGGLILIRIAESTAKRNAA
jgi:phosphatidylglycerol:prolipoprotein diacylglycerol transferase